MTIFSPHPSQQSYPSGLFPSVVTGAGDVAAFIAANKTAIDAGLAQSGSVLFRGFDVPDAQAFDAAITAYGEDGFSYADSLSNAVRVNITPRAFTANEAPPDVSIFLHHEMAQTPLYPAKLFFYCEIAPGEGGATPLCRSDILYERLIETAPETAAKFEALGVRYTNIMPPAPDSESGQGRSWRDTLGAADKAGAEKRLTDLGYSFTWNPDNSLRATTPVLYAVRTLPDGRKVFFNQLIAAFRGWKDARNDPSKSVTFGDGSPIDLAVMQDAIQIADELSYDLSWQAGDIALLDNFIVMHGRRPYKGKRRVLASLVG